MKLTNLELIIEKLVNRGLSTREVSGAFNRRFSIKVTFKNGHLHFDEKDAEKIVKNAAEISRHFEAFLKTKERHVDFCRREARKGIINEEPLPDRSFLRFLKLCGRLCVGVVLAVVLGLLWVLKNHLGKLSAFVFCLSAIFICYHVGEGQSDWEAADEHKRYANKWLVLALCSGGTIIIRAAIEWFRDPVFCPNAAKGFYMGQSLNNQREIKESLNDISDSLKS